MIPRDFFKSFSEKTQEELTDEPFSYRECTKCGDYFDLGGCSNERPDEANYYHLDDFDFDYRKIKQYEKKHNITFDDNVFCYDCIDSVARDLGEK